MRRTKILLHGLTLLAVCAFTVSSYGQDKSKVLRNSVKALARPVSSKQNVTKKIIPQSVANRQQAQTIIRNKAKGDSVTRKKAKLKPSDVALPSPEKLMRKARKNTRQILFGAFTELTRVLPFIIRAIGGQRLIL